MNALHNASSKGRTEVVQLLSTYVVLREEKDEGGNTPFLLAADGGHVGACEILLSAGANVKANDEHGSSALHLACRKGKIAVIELLIRICPSLINAKDDQGNTPLHSAAYEGHVRACQILLAAGADPEAKDKEGDNALHHAAMGKKREVIRLFTGDEYKRLRQAKNKEGFLPLEFLED